MCAIADIIYRLGVNFTADSVEVTTRCGLSVMMSQAAGRNFFFVFYGIRAQVLFTNRLTYHVKPSP